MRVCCGLLAATVALATGRAFALAPNSFFHRASRVAPSLAVPSSVRDFRPRRCSRLFGVVEEFADFKDFDPADDDDEGTQTRALLESALVALEKLENADQQELLDDALTMDEPAIRKEVTTSIPAEQGGESWEFLTDFAVASDAKSVEEESRVTQGAIRLIKLLLAKGAFRKGNLKYAKYPAHPEYPDVKLSRAMKMLDGMPPLEYFFSVRKIIRLVKHQQRLKLGLQLTEDDVETATTAERKYRALFTNKKIYGFLPNPLNFAPLPEYVYKHWEEDKEVARQFLAGTNPVMIEVVKDVDDQLSENLIDYFGKTKLKKLAKEKRLFFVSYDDIAKLEANPHMSHPLNEEPPPEPERVNQERFYHAPIVLFELDEDRTELDIMGIQLDRTPDAKVYTRENSEPEEWLFVKACVTNADSQMHEWVSHLGKTHLTMEPHIIAIHNTLKKNNHPLYTYLRPLCKDTLLLNWGARQTLAEFGPDAFGDYMTSVGTGQFMQLIGMYWKDYDFFESSPLPAELESRGFDEDFDMPCYLFREDGLKLWDAYGQFATDFVDELYETDADVRKDKVLQQWARETASRRKAAVKGFPRRIRDKETLAKILQTLNWISGGLHASVNFPQYEFFTYQANKPLHKKGGIPTEEEIANITRVEIFEDRMPDLTYVKEIMSTAYSLTFQSGHNIDNLADEFDEIGAESYAKFLVRLDEIGDEIEERNKKSKSENKAVYHYLHPTEVPASIDI